jgi:UPF0271 protein
MRGAVDLNCDLGEGFGVWRLGDDDALLEIVSSANVACGFHAGDPSIMRRVCDRAATLGVAVGAQVSYPDLRGFGRRFIDMDPQELADAVVYQVGALDAFARAAGTRVAYVKPHGALYHAAVDHEDQARAIVEAVTAFAGGLAVLGMPGSSLLRRAREVGLDAVGEAFADRGYLPDGRLVPRGADGAVLHDVELVAARVVQLATEGTVRAVDGTVVRVDAGSICLHSDTPGAVALAQAVRSALLAAGIEVRPFTGR